MLSVLLWRLICAHITGTHQRDWNAYDAMGLSRCAHCHKRMPEPGQPPRPRL